MKSESRQRYLGSFEDSLKDLRTMDAVVSPARRAIQMVDVSMKSSMDGLSGYNSSEFTLITPASSEDLIGDRVSEKMVISSL